MRWTRVCRSQKSLISRVSDFKATVETFKKAFAEHDVADAWNYVIAVVVQPGVEEKDAGCTEYIREKASLSHRLYLDHDRRVETSL